MALCYYGFRPCQLTFTGTVVGGDDTLHPEVGAQCAMLPAAPVRSVWSLQSLRTRLCTRFTPHALALPATDIRHTQRAGAARPGRQEADLIRPRPNASSFSKTAMVQQQQQRQQPDSSGARGQQQSARSSVPAPAAAYSGRHVRFQQNASPTASAVPLAPAIKLKKSHKRKLRPQEVAPTKRSVPSLKAHAAPILSSVPRVSSQQRHPHRRAAPALALGPALPTVAAAGRHVLGTHRHVSVANRTGLPARRRAARLQRRNAATGSPDSLMKMTTAAATLQAPHPSVQAKAHPVPSSPRKQGGGSAIVRAAAAGPAPAQQRESPTRRQAHLPRKLAPQGGRTTRHHQNGILQELPVNKLPAVHCQMKRPGAAQALARRKLSTAVVRNGIGAGK